MGDEQRAGAVARLSAESDDDGEGPFSRVARAVADGEQTFPTLNESVDAGLLSQLKVIAQIAGMRRADDVADDAPATDSLGDMLSRAGQPSRDERPDLARARPWGGLFILEKVGGGSFGEVYRAWDPALDREVALKLLRLAQPSSAKADAVVREGRLLAKLHHPNVIDVYGAAKIDGEVGIWMEFVRGRTLERIVAEEGPMSAQEAALVAESLCSALAAVHQQGLLHRDIKAANVMRESGGRYVLLDFGTGTEVAPDEATVGRLAGTPLYMAPEVMENAPATVQSDIYSVGVLLFFLVTGTYPVYGKTLSAIRTAHRQGRRVLLSDVRTDVPMKFVKVVERAIAPTPASRFTTAGAVMAAVQGEADPPAVSARLWLRLAATTIAALVGIAVLGYVTSGAFTYQLGITDQTFLPEPFFVQMQWGAMSAVPTLIYIGLAIGLFHMAALAWRVFRTLVPSAGALGQRAGAVVADLFHRSGLDDPTAAMQLVIAAGLLALGAVIATHLPLLGALTTPISTAPPADLAPLNRENVQAHSLYGIGLDMIVLFVIVSARWVLQRARRRHRAVPRGTVAAVVIVACLPVLLHAWAWRILYKTQFRQVMYAGQMCYALGQRPGELLLHCPGTQPPRNRVVSHLDERMVVTETFGSVFDTYRAPSRD